MNVERIKITKISDQTILLDYTVNKKDYSVPKSAVFKADGSEDGQSIVLQVKTPDKVGNFFTFKAEDLTVDTGSGDVVFGDVLEAVEALNSFVGLGFKSGGVTPPTPTTDKLRVRFISPIPDENGNCLIEERYVDKGTDVLNYPGHHSGDTALFPDGWTIPEGDLRDIQRDTDVGALYRTNGDTILELKLSPAVTMVTFNVQVLGRLGDAIRWWWNDTEYTIQEWGTDRIDHQFPAGTLTARVRIELLYGDGYILGGGTNTTPFCGGSVPAGKATLQKIFIGDNVELAYYCFSQASMLSAVVMPRSITLIPSYAFYQAGNLRSLIFPPGILTLSSYAANGAYTLKYVVLPTGIYSILNYSFQYCYNLSDPVIPDTVRSISDYAFQYNYNIQKIEFPKGLESIGNNSFQYCNSLTEIVWPEALTMILNDAFTGCTALKSVTGLPNTLTRLGNNTFSSCSTLRKCELPDSVSTMGSGIFSSCYNMESIPFPKNVNANAIPNNYAVTAYRSSSVSIPPGVYSVGVSAFHAVFGTDSVTIPASVTTMYANAFADMRLREVIMESEIPCSITSSSFGNFIQTGRIFVPDGAVAAYKAATNWSALASYIFPISQRGLI